MKDEAIRLVNKAFSDQHPHLLAISMNKFLGHKESNFVKKHPFLKDCPAHALRQVIGEAIAGVRAQIQKQANSEAAQPNQSCKP